MPAADEGVVIDVSRILLGVGVPEKVAVVGEEAAGDVVNPIARTVVRRVKPDFGGVAAGGWAGRG